MKKVIQCPCKIFLIIIFISSASLFTHAQPKSKKTISRKPVRQQIVKAPDEEEFIAAIRADNWQLVKRMISQGANVNIVTESTLWRPVHYAAYRYDASILNLLLQKGADVNAADSSGDTPLHIAITCTCETAKERLKMDKFIDALLKGGANINAQNEAGETPLMSALMYSDTHLAAIKMLLDKGADLNLTNAYGENAAQMIVEAGKTDAVAKLILSQSKPSVAQFKEKPSDELLFSALKTTNRKRVMRLVEAGANVNAVDESGRTPLYLAAEDCALENVNLLLQKGAKVNVSDERGITPLHRAVGANIEKPDIAVVKALLDAGANVNAQSKTGETVLITAIKNTEADFSIIKLLVDSGANPNLVGSENDNALQIAILEERKDVVELLKPITKSVDDRRAQLSGKFFKSDDVEIYYEVRGAKTGTPLFVLHGGPGFDHQYLLSNSVFETLGKTRPVIFYDQRGSGFSSRLTKSQTATVKDNIEDLKQLRKYLGYEKIDLMGHSWGGFLAMAYALDYPTTISHLIICDTLSPDYKNDYSTFASVYPDEFAVMNQKRMEAGFNNDAKALRESVVAYMKMLFHSPEKRDSFIAGSQNFTYSLSINSAVNRSAWDLDLTKSLVKITAPTLIVHGKHDMNITYDVAERIQKRIPKAQLVIFDESGHLPFYEEPEKFISIVEDFLNGKKVSGK